MIDDIKPHDPHIFTGAGLRALEGEEALAEPIIQQLERDIGFNRTDTPWVMTEFVFETQHPDALEFIRKTLAVHIGVSDMHCPTAVDPDVPPSPDFPHPFIIGESPDPSVPTYLLSGTVSERFLAAWKKYQKIYFELHLWIRRTDPAKDESMFMWLVMGKDSPLRFIVQSDKPVIIPVDKSRGYRCIYAQKKGWGV